jgi:acyl-CoA synthetase (AMP-forming)/AMP-acid ligase II
MQLSTPNGPISQHPTNEHPLSECSSARIALEADGKLAQCANEKSSLLSGFEAIIDGGPLADELQGESMLCVHQIVKQRAMEQPDTPAIIGLHRTLSYSQLWHEVERLAALIQSQKGKPELHQPVFGKPVRFPSVAILLPHCEEYIICNLAIFEAGSSMLLLEPHYSKELVVEMLQNTGVGLVLTQSALGQNLPTDLLKAKGITVFCVEGRDAGASGTSGAWLHACDGLVAEPAETGLDELAYITMTSGSTGKPKAIRNTHRAATIDFLARIQMFPYAEVRAGQSRSRIFPFRSRRSFSLQDETMEGLNMFFAWECLRPLLRCRTAVIIPDEHMFDVPAFLLFIRQHGIQRFMISPSLLRSIVDYPGQNLGKAFELTKFIYLQGEVLPAPTMISLYEREKAHALVNTEILNIYGAWYTIRVCRYMVYIIRVCRYMGMCQHRVLAGAPRQLQAARGAARGADRGQDECGTGRDPDADGSSDAAGS